MRDDELTEALRSPALSLEPPPDLLDSVRRGARRTRRRRAAGTAALSAAALATAALLGPSRAGGDGERPDQLADALQSRFPAATTPVEVLEPLNGGQVVTFFERRRWCTAAVRNDAAQSCSRALGSTVQPFAFVRTPGNESLTVDRESLVAGVLGTGVVRVEVLLSDGTSPVVSTTAPAGYPRPVWWTRVKPGAGVEELRAYDADGRLVGTA